MTRVNGEETEQIPVTDRGLQYGDGLFETIAIHEGHPCLLDAHLDRLQKGCERLQIPVPDMQQLARDCRDLARGAQETVLKIVLTRGSGGRGYRLPEQSVTRCILSLHAWQPLPAQFYEQGVQLRYCDLRLADQPRLAGIKHLNRLEQVLARLEWSSDDIYEGILLNRHDNIVECVSSNLFMVDRSGVLQTPALDKQGVEGVMRAQILSLARDLDRAVIVTRIDPEQLQQASEVFISNSLIGILPVCAIGKHKYRPGAITAGLRQALPERILPASRP